MPRSLSSFIFLIVFILPPLAKAEVTQGIELNAEERAWISKNPHFKVGAHPLDPYIIESGNKATGYMVDLLQAIARQVGLEPKFQFLPLKEIMKQLREGTVDASMALLHNKAREKLLHLSKESVTVNLSIFALKGIRDITGLESLSGKTLASYQSYALNPLFKKYLPDVNILMAKDIKGMFSMVAMGKADAFIQEPNTGNYLLRRWLISNIETMAFAAFAGKKDYQSHYYAVGKHAPLLASILDKSHHFMPVVEKQRLWNRWFAAEATILDDKFLSAEEEAYIASMTFNRAQANEWIPFNFNSNDGDVIGINEDYWALIRNKLGIKETTNSPLPFAEILQVMKQGQVDLLVCTTRTKERETYAVFSDSFEEFPIAIACKSHDGFITDASVLEGEVVAVGRNYSAYHMLKARYPGIKFLQVDDTREALEKVASGEAYAAIDILPALEYQIKKYTPEVIKISGVTDIPFPLQVMISSEHAQLLPLINRAIAAITPQEHKAIYKKWAIRSIIAAPDYTLLWQVLGVALLIIGIILYWNRRLAKEIAQRKQTEIALHESDTRYHLAMDATQDGVWDWDLKTGEVNYSPSWKHILGDKTTGNDYLAWESRIHPDDKPRILETLHSHLAGEIPVWVEEHRLRRYDNSWVWVLGRGKVVKRDSDGSPLRMLGTMTDINTQKQTEEMLHKLARVVEQSQESVVITNLNTKIEYVNQAFLKQTGYSMEEILGQKPSILQTGKTAPETYKSLWDALNQGRAWKGELTNKGKDGSEFIEYVHITPLKQPDGSITHYVAVKEDITEKKKIAQELDHHRHHLEELVAIRTEQLESANKSKSTFLANMSHEIRTPMNAILGMAKIGFRDSTDTIGKKTFNHILDSSNHLLGIINDILDFSKIEAGKLTTESRAFQLISILESSVNLNVERAREKGLKLSVDLPADLPAWVLGDPLRLQQILLNLLSNAIKFTSLGEVRVSVVRDGEMTYFKIKDSGIGLNEEQISRLFKPFEQADKTTTRVYGGSGLGLAISYDLAQLMGGDIHVESQINEGSNFILSLLLPATKAHENENYVVLKSSGPQLSGLRVLAAEDIDINRLILEDLLEHEGASVVFAEDGQQAIDRLHQIGPDNIDVILMDVQMPVMDGIEATRQINALFPGLPIIGVTAHALKEESDKCLTAGMVAHLTKPIDTEALITAIKQHVNNF